MMSWILAGIDQLAELRESIVFKGGTALRKCYFQEYRYSEDLDFSARDGAPRGDALERLMSQAADIAVSLVNEAETGENRPFAIECRRYTEKRPHPSQEAFKPPFATVHEELYPELEALLSPSSDPSS